MKIGDVVKYKKDMVGRKGTVIGVQKDNYVVKLDGLNSMFGQICEPEEIKAPEKDFELITSVDDVFYVLKTKNGSAKFYSLDHLKQNITPKNMDTCEIYKVTKLPQPKITIFENR